MKITKEHLMNLIKEELGEAKKDTGPLNVGRELAAKAAGTAGLTPVDPKAGVHTAMTRSEEKLLGWETDSGGKFISLTIKRANGDQERFWGRTPMDAFKAYVEAGKKNTDKVVGLENTKPKGEKISPQVLADLGITATSDVEDDEDLDETSVSAPSAPSTPLMHENKTKFTKQYLMQVINEELKKVLSK